MNNIPVLQTCSNHETKTDAFHESNKAIVDRWHKEEERRKKLHNDKLKKNAEKRAENAKKRAKNYEQRMRNNPIQQESP